MLKFLRKKTKLNSSGFTLVELMVTMTVMGILLAITFVGLNSYIKNAEFKKCNEYARTIYTAASLETSSLELAADLERFTDQVKLNGSKLESSDSVGTNYPDIYEPGRIYAIKASAGDYDQYKNGAFVSPQAELVFELIDNYSYDKDVCNNSITIEYDTFSQSVYSVFISTWATDFVYSNDHAGDYTKYDERGIVSLNAAGVYETDRDYYVRKSLNIGYYCVPEVGVDAEFNAGPIRVTQCYLDNKETLDLVLSSNSIHDDADTKYKVVFYNAADDSKMFALTYSLVDAYAGGYDATYGDLSYFMKIKVTSYPSETEKDMVFPISYSNHSLRLTLDATMSAHTMDQINKNSADDISTSFQRFLKDKKSLPDIYAVASVEQLTEAEVPTGYDVSKKGVRLWIDTEEYIPGAAVTSNTENAFYKAVGSDVVELAYSRHLANIRYYTNSNATSFALTNDISFDHAIVYDLTKGKSGGTVVMEEMQLHGNMQKAFPSIPKFDSKWTLTGKKTLGLDAYMINHLVLTEESVERSAESQKGIGLVMNNEGTIANIAFHGSELQIGYATVTTNGGVVVYNRDAVRNADYVQAAGIVCGVNTGTIQSIEIGEDTIAHVSLTYHKPGSVLSGVDVDNIDKCYGIGLLCGVQASKTLINDCRTAGELEGYFENLSDRDQTLLNIADSNIKDRYRYAGIGGVTGFIVTQNYYTSLGKKPSALKQTLSHLLNITEKSDIKNTANIIGNYMIGGIAGNAYVLGTEKSTMPIIQYACNEGLIHLEGANFDLVGDNASTDLTIADNCFAGGIIGLLNHGAVKECYSANGIGDKEFSTAVMDATLTGEYIYPGEIPKTVAHKTLVPYLTGNYVGGIAGAIVDGELQDCYTDEGGYVFGHDEVGGIVGYLADLSDKSNRLNSSDSSEVENGCYVIGHSDVGGIVGKNTAGNKIQNCINNGVVAGSGQNIGGIAGKNTGTAGNPAVLENCTSNVMDYDGSTYQLVSEIWAIYGDNAGGLVGLNEYGKVGRTDSKEYHVSAIVVGNNNVGGVFGLAGAGTWFDFDAYSIEGGEVYARGDCAGGYIGLNLAQSALPTMIEEVKPYYVRGRYGVGGAIGANVILQNNEKQDITIRFTNANTFGTVYGNNAVGGIIGYQRSAYYSSGSSYARVYNRILKEEPGNGMNNTFFLCKRSTNPTKIDGQNTLWIVDRENYNGSDKYDMTPKAKTTITGDNAAAVIAGSYGAGILGYGCSFDTIQVVNCTNRGEICDFQASGETDKDKILRSSIAMIEFQTDHKISDEAYAYIEKAASGSSISTNQEPIGSFVAGIQGYVSEKGIITNCHQESMIYSHNGLGGIAGFNEGTIIECSVSSNLGTQDSNIVGGIAAINAKQAKVQNCTVGKTDEDFTIEGKNIVGGFFGINESTEKNISAQVNFCTKMYMNLSCASDGYAVGGLAGINLGDIWVHDYDGYGKEKTRLTVVGGNCVGGVAGIHGGRVHSYFSTITTAKLEVQGENYVGGLFGEIDHGLVCGQNNDNIHSKYKNVAKVTAMNGWAGGVTGNLEAGDITNATNLASVKAGGKNGYAAGIAPVVKTGLKIENCSNDANITSDHSYAGAITAWNEGELIADKTGESKITIASNAEYMGAITPYNASTGKLQNCSVIASSITLNGSGKLIGALAAVNKGEIYNDKEAPHDTVNGLVTFVTTTKEKLTFGGAVGRNENQVNSIGVKNAITNLQGNCMYFGGVVGENLGAVENSFVSTLIIGEQNAAPKMSCYGGVVGINGDDTLSATVTNSYAKKIAFETQGIYQANASQSAAKQEKLTSCLGGVVGKNQMNAKIQGCRLDTSDFDGNFNHIQNVISCANGLVGGVVGMNKGEVTDSGYKDAATIMKALREELESFEAANGSKEHFDLKTETEKHGLEYLTKTNTMTRQMIEHADTNYISNISSVNETSLTNWLNAKSSVPSMMILLDGNGSVGGIAAYNTQTGKIGYCVSGRWLLWNISASQYSAEGGIIGTNESASDVAYLVNQAVVVRASKTAATDRFNGGIIGNQHNTTNNDWTIYGCINTGAVLNCQSHYSGGIIGRWSDNGGSIEYCRNYGSMQTGYQAEYKGSAAGIVAQLYHPINNQNYNVLSCRNDGNIWGSGTDGKGKTCANDSSGIMGSVVMYQGNSASQPDAPNVEINLIDNVNGRVTMVAKALLSSMLTLVTSDLATGNQSTTDYASKNVLVRIDRCRNYATDVDAGKGVAGMFGDRFSSLEKTHITNCFTLAPYKLAGDSAYINYSGRTGKNDIYNGVCDANSYNNRVLPVTSDTGKTKIMNDMLLTGRKTISSNDPVGDDKGKVYIVKAEEKQKIRGSKGEEKPLQQILNNSDSILEVYDSKESPQFYIQLNQPLYLRQLKLLFEKNGNNTYRVEYLTAGSGTFVLADEVIRTKNDDVTVELPQSAYIVALRIQMMQNTVEKGTEDYNKHGLYYSNSGSILRLKHIELSKSDGSMVSLDSLKDSDEKELSFCSPRIAELGLASANHWLNSSSQYLYAYHSGNQTMLIEPISPRKKLSSSCVGGSAANYYEDPDLQLHDYAKAGGEKEIYDNHDMLYGVGILKCSESVIGQDGEIKDIDQFDQELKTYYKDGLAGSLAVEGRPVSAKNVNIQVKANTKDVSSGTPVVHVTWTPATAGADQTLLYYLVKLKCGDTVIKTMKCYSDEAKIPVSKELYGKDVSAEVYAVNEKGMSEKAQTEQKVTVQEPMIAPEVRVELFKDGTTYKYRYSLTRECLDKLNEKYEDNWKVVINKQGTEDDSAIVGTITPEQLTFVNEGYDINSKTAGKASWQLYAQTICAGKEGKDTYPPSEKYTTSMFTPKFTKDQNGKCNWTVPQLKHVYCTFDRNYKSEMDVKLNVHVQAESTLTGIYPLYQVDLIMVHVRNGAKTSKILASRDLVVDTSDSVVTFTDLPSEFFEQYDDGYTYFYARAWLSQLGMGPVYTWHEQETTGDKEITTEGIIQESRPYSLLANTLPQDESYVYSAMLEDAQSEQLMLHRYLATSIPTSRTDESTKASSDHTITESIAANAEAYAIKAHPKLKAVTPMYDRLNDTWNYKLDWTDSYSTSGQLNYELMIYGSHAGETDKILLVDQDQIERTDINDKESPFTYTFLADDVVHENLELVMIQRNTGYAPIDSGSLAGKGKIVPRAVKAQNTIRTRLPQLSQPSVKLADQNDLVYKISWKGAGASVENQYADDLKYALYARYKENGLDVTKRIATTTTTSVTVDLEKYAAKTLRLYAIAYMDENDLTDEYDQTNDEWVAQTTDTVTMPESKYPYFKSKIGLTKKVTIANRINAPIFMENPFIWTYKDIQIDLGNDVLTESQFTSNSLKLDVKLDNNTEDIYSNNYLLNGLIFATEGDAQQFVNELKTLQQSKPYSAYVRIETLIADWNAQSGYDVLSSGGKPIMMSLKSRKEAGFTTYTASVALKDISYAGCYLVPFVRATSTTNTSSYWAYYNYYKMPKVMLDTPTMDHTAVENIHGTLGESFKNSVDETGTAFTNVNVKYDTYTFTKPDYVASDKITLKTRDGQIYTLTVSDTEVVVDGIPEIGSKTYTLGDGECLIDVITNQVEGVYRISKKNKAYYRFTFDTGITRTIEADGTVKYTLRLPQTKYAITCDGGYTISGVDQLITDIQIQAIPTDTSRFVESGSEQ